MENDRREKRMRLLRSINLRYDEELPIVQRREEIAGLIRENQVLIVCGETGSGKSTQLPKICLEIARGISGTIGHTQPRRIAARTIANRIAEELETPLGQAVGYQVRFEEKISSDSLVKLMTDGILLAETQSDPFFRRYDTLIIDEAHERSLNIDFLLGMLKRVLPKRPDLKLIITSATIDANRFAEHFSAPGINGNRPVPVIEVSGRTYPIEIRYRSLEDFDDDDAVSRETNLEERAILAAVDELAEHARQSGLPGRGDMLIFLPTERDIFETAKALRHHAIPGDDRARKTEILPLYARLPIKEQQKVFNDYKKSGNRKIVLATNVAESSLTVPGIRYVIDTGTARISRYSARSRTQRLPIEAISRASADQRTGRCGRVGPGVCIRLYSEQDYATRDQYTTPEIQRTNLASVILQTISLRLGDIQRFPFLDPPRISAINDGYKTLFEIGAIDSDNKLTGIGRKLSRWPVDPRIGRMILAASENGCLREMLIVAAALEIQDPRERPQEHQEKADTAHARYIDERSDFIGYLRLWDFYQNLKDQTSRSGLRKACRQHFLSFNRMKEWSDIHIQLRQFVHEAKMQIGSRKKELDEVYAPLHRSILVGNLSGIAQRSNRFEYQVANSSGGTGGKFVLWPGSGLQKKRHPDRDRQGRTCDPSSEPEKTDEKNKGLPHWVMASERVETSRRYLRTVAQIEAGWIEPLAGHLIKRTYQEPHWNRETGYVHAFERISLLGIVIVPKRRINYGPIDPKAARDLFIQQALVEDQLDTKLEFLEYNRTVLEEARTLQNKLRRPDIVRPESARYEFYQARIPDEVFDRRSLEKWAEDGPPAGSNEQTLYLSLQDLCAGGVSEDMLRQFPDRLETFDGSRARIEYCFAPGEENDGLTVVVPQEGLRQLEPGRLGWLVPGLIERKIVALLKSLPKEIRRQIVPVPDTAREIVGEIEFGQGRLEEQIAEKIGRRIGRLVVSTDFDIDQLPRELRMNIRVLDETGKPVGEGRDLLDLRKRFGIKSSETVAESDPRWNRTGLTDWDFGDLPESIELNRGGVRLKAFPMLFLAGTDQGLPSVAGTNESQRSLALGLADSPDKAVRETRRGIIELFFRSKKKDIRSQIHWLPQADKLRVYAQALPEFDFQQDIGRLIAARALQVDELPIPRMQEEFRKRSALAGERLGVAIQEITKWIGSLLESFHHARLSIEQNKTARAEATWRDARDHLRRLTRPGFLLDPSWSTLREFPRYFKAIPMRFEKLRNGGEVADRAATNELSRYWERYTERLELHQAAGIVDPELEIFRWMLEEYRVSLFAQRLGTAMKVSSNRLDKQFEKIRH